MRLRARIPRAALVLLLAAAAGPAHGQPPMETVRARHRDATPEGPSVADRLAEIRRRIERALVYPPLARWQDVHGETLVRFVIDEGGHPRDVAIARSSGQPVLDAAALRAVADAGRLPRVLGPLEIPVRFELQRR